jgi:hypothetical protein
MVAPATFVVIPKTEKEVVFKEYPNVEICVSGISLLTEEEIRFILEATNN